MNEGRSLTDFIKLDKVGEGIILNEINIFILTLLNNIFNLQI